MFLFSALFTRSFIVVLEMTFSVLYETCLPILPQRADEHPLLQHYHRRRGSSKEQCVRKLVPLELLNVLGLVLAYKNYVNIG